MRTFFPATETEPSSQEVPASQSMRTNWEILKYVIILFVGWRLALLFATFLGLSIFANTDPVKQTYFTPTQSLDYWGRWALWDGGHYLNIAEHGYSMLETVFFPLYPLLIKIVSLMSVPPLWAGLAISQACTIITLFFLYKLALLDFDDQNAKRALIALLIFPTSFYLVAVYTESLFLAIAVAAFYYARRRKWLLAFVIAGFAPVTRLVGIAVVIGVVAEYLLKSSLISTLRELWRTKRYRSPLRAVFELLFASVDFSRLLSVKFAYLIPSFVPLSLYMFYLGWQFGMPTAFIANESQWGKYPSLPWHGMLLYWHNLVNEHFFRIPDSSWVLPHVVLYWMLIICLIISFFRLRDSYTVYFFLAFLIPISSGSLSDLLRYALALFPFFFILAFIKNDVLRTTGMIFSALTLSTLSMFFINGYWYM